MQPWHTANLEHAFSLVGSVQVDTMQSDNQSSHRRGKEQARSKHASWSLGPAESCGEGAAIMVGGGLFVTGVWPLGVPRAERM